MYHVDVPLHNIESMDESSCNAGRRTPGRTKTAETLTLAAAAVVLSLDVENPRNVLEKLERLLKQGNSSCLNLIDDLRVVPGSGELIHEMENFYFGCALVILGELKNEMKKEDILWITREKIPS